MFLRIRADIHIKGPTHPSPFSMPPKLLILHSEAKSYCLLQVVFLKVCFIIFNYSSFTVDFLRFDMLRIEYNSQTLPCKQQLMLDCVKETIFGSENREPRKITIPLLFSILIEHERNLKCRT